jgi:hypothetical protein
MRQIIRALTRKKEAVILSGAKDLLFLRTGWQFDSLKAAIRDSLK